MIDQSVFAHRIRAAVLVAVTLGSMLEVAFVLERPGELDWYRLVSFFYLVVGVVVYITVVRAIQDHHPSHPIGWLLLLFVASPASSVVANGYTIWQLPGSALVNGAARCAGAPAVAALAMALVLFPTGRVHSRRWRWLAWSCVTVGVAATVLAVVAPWPYPPYPNDTYLVSNPLGIESLADVHAATLSLSLVLLLGAIGSLIARYRSTAGIERDQIRAIGLAGVLLAVGVFSAASAALTGDLDSVDSDASNFLIGDALFALLASAIAVAIGAGMIRYRLYGIDRLISRAIAYAVLIVVSGAMFAVVVAVWSSVAGGTSPAFAIVVAGTVIVVALQPVRTIVERRIEQRVFGGRPGSWDAVRRLTNDLSDVASQQSVPHLVASAAREATGARSARAEVVLPDGTSVEAVVGNESTSLWDSVIEIYDEHTRVGELAVAAGDWRRRDRPVLERVADVASGAMVNVRLQAELDALHTELQRGNMQIAASRRRLIVAAADERRRLRDDVRHHLDPRLAQIREGFDAALVTAGRHPDAVAGVAADLLPSAVTVVEAVRALSRGVLPPVLSDLGLAAAVRSVARRVAFVANISVDPDVEHRRFSQDIEMVAFLCCRAFLDDAGVAGASHLHLRLQVQDEALIISGTRDGESPAELSELLLARDRIRAHGGDLHADIGDNVQMTATIPAHQPSVEEDAPSAEYPAQTALVDHFTSARNISTA